MHIVKKHENLYYVIYYLYDMMYLSDIFGENLRQFFRQLPRHRGSSTENSSRDMRGSIYRHHHYPYVRHKVLGAPYKKMMSLNLSIEIRQTYVILANVLALIGWMIG